jgi:hypothetical protein
MEILDFDWSWGAVSKNHTSWCCLFETLINFDFGFWFFFLTQELLINQNLLGQTSDLLAKHSKSRTKNELTKVNDLQFYQYCISGFMMQYLQVEISNTLCKYR